MTTTFKVGDRVRLQDYEERWNGRAGTIVRIKELHLTYPFIIDLDHVSDELPAYHGAVFEAHELALITPKPARTYDLNSQNGRILAHLLGGHTITPLTAIGVFGAYRLAARIRELREAGHKIKTTMKRDAFNKPYAEYSLRNAGRVYA